MISGQMDSLTGPSFGGLPGRLFQPILSSYEAVVYKTNMRLISGALLTAVFSVCQLFPGGQAVLEQSTPIKPEETIILFNGKDLTGWNTTGNWIVEEGNIVALHPRPGEQGWTRYDAYLTTARKYKDFILDLEFKFEKDGNSGVFLRVGDPKSQVDSGMEVQILDTYGKKNVGAHDCGGVIGTAAPSKNMVKPAGEWNRYVITADENMLTVELNGKKVNELDLDRWTEPRRNPDGSENKFKFAYKEIVIPEVTKVVRPGGLF